MTPLLTSAAVKRAVAGAAGITVAELAGRQQGKRIAVPRFLAMELCRTRGGLTSGQVGRAFERDHTTVLSGWRRARELMLHDEGFRRLADEAERRLDDMAAMPSPEDPWDGLDVADALCALGRALDRMTEKVAEVQAGHGKIAAEIRAIKAELVVQHRTLTDLAPIKDEVAAANVGIERRLAAIESRLDRRDQIAAHRREMRAAPEREPAPTHEIVTAPASASDMHFVPVDGAHLDAPRPRVRKPRTCLGPLCEGRKSFDSDGADNRVCPRCAAYLAGNAALAVMENA